MEALCGIAAHPLQQLELHRVLDALGHPDRTWLGSDVVLGPSTSEVARRHADILDNLSQHSARMASTATVFA